MSENQDHEGRPKPIVSAILQDAMMIEMIHRPQKRETSLLEWRDGATVEHSSVDLPDIGRVAPYSATNNLIAHGVVLFPSAAQEYEDVDTLTAAVRSFIHRYADVSDGFEEIASYYVVLSWVYDSFSVLPYLRLKGDFGTGKSRVLQVIGSVCYKPMFVSGASTVSPIFRIIDTFRGTLVLDESDFRFSDERAEIVKILNNGNAKGFPVLRSEATPTKEYNPRAFDVFGPKLIATRRDFDDAALESRCITEVMAGLPPRKDIPLSLPDTFHTEAEILRNQLLIYRFRNYSTKREVRLRDDGLEARVAQVFGPLLAIAEKPEARAHILALARGQAGRLTAERSASIEAQLLDIMYEMRRERSALGVKEIADRFAERYGLDFQRPITARWIGAQLRKRLSLVPVKIHGNFEVAESELVKLDALFERYGLGEPPGDVGTLGTSLGLTGAGKGAA